MRYIRQKYAECLLTAVCQVVPSLNIAIERLSYRDRHGFVTRRSIAHWIRTRFSELYNAVEKVHSCSNPKPLREWEKYITKKGIVLISNWDTRARHAVSYEKGLLLDSDYTGVTESTKEFLIRKSNYFVEVVIPIERD